MSPQSKLSTSCQPRRAPVVIRYHDDYRYDQCKYVNTKVLSRAVSNLSSCLRYWTV